MGAGYRGWVLLIDEVELIRHYSALQRGKSYAELARWMGRVEGAQYPGLTAVATITDEFSAMVLDEKGDRDSVGPRLRSKGTDELNILAAQAEVGMRIIEREAMTLAKPDDAVLDQTYRGLKEIHARAYDWEPPEVDFGTRSTTRALWSYVRRLINEWDLKRLYPDIVVDTEEEKIGPTYTEDVTLEQSSDDQAASDDGEGRDEQDAGSVSG